ncbi:hypothetical protein ACFV0R_15630 [Streptomyces sp. NPDC059578]|uniref:hypothetical protein n=1 Tax=Streptomyces sp. NPDC059578 TaxID=3346874 RepID=UPI0036B3DAF1
MADEETQPAPGDDSQPQGNDSGEPDPAATFEMELVDGLPGGRAILGLEVEGRFTWLADRAHVSEQARDELVEQLTYIVEQGLWIQNWPRSGRNDPPTPGPPPS